MNSSILWSGFNHGATAERGILPLRTELQSVGGYSRTHVGRVGQVRSFCEA